MGAFKQLKMGQNFFKKKMVEKLGFWKMGEIWERKGNGDDGDGGGGYWRFGGWRWCKYGGSVLGGEMRGESWYNVLKRMRGKRERGK